MGRVHAAVVLDTRFALPGKAGIALDLAFANLERTLARAPWNGRLIVERYSPERVRQHSASIRRRDAGDDYVGAMLFFGLDGAAGPGKGEIAALEEFRALGGGLFATGDHANLGLGLCGGLPVAGLLRNWNAPKQDLLATTWTSDSEPLPPSKPVFPNAVGGSIHPLLSKDARHAIRFLPDHAHEGSLGAAPLGLPGEVSNVAYAVAWGRRPAPPQLVPVVRSFEPNDSAHGRVVVDSTFHHWLDKNVRGLTREEREDVDCYHANVLAYILDPVARKALAAARLASVLREDSLALELALAAREAQEREQRVACTSALGSLIEQALAADGIAWSCTISGLAELSGERVAADDEASALDSETNLEPVQSLRLRLGLAALRGLDDC